VSDVTAEDVNAERPRAHELARNVYRCNDHHMNKQHSNHCDDIATALAACAREARREALKEAAGVCRLRGQFTMAEAIRALMGTGT
jgi:hypothetical protein